MFQRQAKMLANGPYDCPNCGKLQLQIFIDSKNKTALAKCPSCGLEKSLRYAPVFQGIDYYSKFVDDYKKSQLNKN